MKNFDFGDILKIPNDFPHEQIPYDEKIALEQRRAEAQVCVDLIELLRKKGENLNNPKVDECQKKITDLGFINEGGKAMTNDEWLNYQKRAKLTDSQGSNQGGDTKPKVNINTAIFGAIGGGVGYLVAKNLIKTDKVIIPILIGAAAFAYYQIDMSKKM